MNPVTVVSAFLTFCLLDTLFFYAKMEGRYYAVHALHNAAITVFTAPQVYQTLTDFPHVQDLATPTIASEFIVALHVYHAVMYFRKLRFDDWLHHALMIGVALPLGLCSPPGSLMGYSLFFTTGLPGGIDYVLLTAVRNGWLDSAVEKRTNAAIQVWIRSPGCVSFAAFVCAFLTSQHEVTWVYWIAALLTAALNYWNGQHFAAQVVYDVGKRQLLE
jgi:hypothetical protein